MERTDNKLMTSITALKDELSARQDSAFQNSPDFIALQQAFDRLVLGVQSGQFEENDVEKGIAEIRSHFNKPAVTTPLLPRQSSSRNRVLSRNYKDLATRMLDEKRGTWDSRHVEIVQGAIEQLAKCGVDDAQQLASGLQKRMSENVWLGQLEIAENVAQVHEVSQSLENDLRALLEKQQESLRIRELHLPEVDRVVAQEQTPDTSDEIHNAVQQASRDAVRTQMHRDLDALHQSKTHLEALAQSAESSRQNRQTSEISTQLRLASQKLLDAEAQKLIDLLKSALVEVCSSMTPNQANVLTTLGDQLAAHSHDAEAIRQSTSTLRQTFQNTPQLQNILVQLDGIAQRTEVLQQLAAPNPPESTDDESEAQYLDARMMFEQKKMQFEQNRHYQNENPDLLKALDSKTPRVRVASSTDAMRNALKNVQRVHQIAQHVASGDVGLYAPTSGSEYARNARQALKIADDASPIVTPIPTLQSETAKRTNRLLRDVRQLAFMPSVRAEMGFSAKHTQIQEQTAPLFKRVQFSRDNKKANEMLPALYNVSDVKLKGKSNPLRKAFSGLNLNAANLELVKIIEDQFDEKKESSEKKLSDIQVKAASRFESAIGTFLDGRKKTTTQSADEGEKVDADSMNVTDMENALRSEAQSLPSDVVQKLTPFLGFDISSVKVYAGSVAAKAAEAMGAHAFTLGKSIFLGEKKLDYTSAEGLGLLAHEILHTSHFDKGDSVESKEQAAEAVESRVKNAFDTATDFNLALERAAETPKSTVQATSATPAVSTKQRYDVDAIYDEVSEMVAQMILESVEAERNKRGH